MNSALNIKVSAAIDDQQLKWAKDMVMGYAIFFEELMDWIYSRYGQIMTGDLMKNTDSIQTAYHVKEHIEIIFDQIETGQ